MNAAATLRCTSLPSLDLLPDPKATCRAVVIVPARNEEGGLWATLERLCSQVDESGARLPHETYEVLLLLNNCTDGSAAVAEAFAQKNPDFDLHIVTCMLNEGQAHVGTARRMLMEVACSRLEWLGDQKWPALDIRCDGQEHEGSRCFAILSTDADTLVSPDWIAANLSEIEAGADVVGGVIHLVPSELDDLEEGVRWAYDRDRRLQALVARFESLLDPDPADPWPRHLQHFGASLACTPEIYRASGGMPAVKPLEDVAFVEALRRVGARLRHSPNVHIYTSARMAGRAEVGLSGQLRHWRREAEAGIPHIVDSAEWMEHRFRTMGGLRAFFRNRSADLAVFPEHWHPRLLAARGQCTSTEGFLEMLDCDALIEESFRTRADGPQRQAEISSVLRRLEEMINELR